ncbi:PUB domain containing protein, putative [Trypanosoma equiperdum]|uniref:PUB domain-containing protein n=2 Tax=Trypanozoon TaxID=39700 RepID=C9ZJV1_TRYB9|nr:hypothetical protein, conserved [Trypanosoma brucei gambiense DAL972]CBH09715.1 hypothetical protein, conserved [Trypanosoma brucei gambiense DAL972]SCU69965.1 PUB domain containing protein, putative [Trypanosoma equiperdum]|eukprot:XP_011772008.1 hypothetical protein, conserved [Trypanosoma brucei gambiense DAL972]
MKTLHLLLGLMHCDAPLNHRVKGLTILKRMLSNVVNYPTECKYRSINITSSTWINSITPAFHVFQLIEWLLGLGFEQSVGDSFLIFKGSSLDCMANACRDVSLLLYACEVDAPSNTSGSKRCVDDLVPLLRVVSGHNDQCGSNTVDTSQAIYTALQPSVSDETWKVLKNRLRLIVLECECERQNQPRLKEKLCPPTLAARNLEAWTSLCELVRFINLRHLEEGLAAVNMERFESRGVRKVDTRGGEKGNINNLSNLVAARQKDKLSLQNSGRASIDQEVQAVGTRLIVDIASCIEQISVLEGDQGLVRKDRLEAKRLLEKFGEDGDVRYLHLLREEWSQRLEEKKKIQGNSFVYFK